MSCLIMAAGSEDWPQGYRRMGHGLWQVMVWDTFAAWRREGNSPELVWASEGKLPAIHEDFFRLAMSPLTSRHQTDACIATQTEATLGASPHWQVA